MFSQHWIHMGMFAGFYGGIFGKKVIYQPRTMVNPAILPSKSMLRLVNFVYLFTGGACVGFVYLKNLEVESKMMSSMTSLDWWRNMQETAHMNG